MSAGAPRVVRRLVSRGGPAWVRDLLLERWRRSLQVRVVATTLAVSAVVVALVGVVVQAQVRDGIVRTKVKAATAQASAGITEMQNSLGQLAVADNSTTLDQVLFDGVARLTGEGSEAGRFDIALLSPSGVPRGGEISRDIEKSTIPPELRAAVPDDGSQVYQFVRLVHTGGKTEPGLAIGGALSTPSGYTYQLYYLFPLTSEAATLALVQRTLVFGGLALVLLLAAIAWLVTRQVVQPVRHSARIAEMLAAGRLQERMAVRGSDDLAKLGLSFNRMAESLQGQIRELEELSRVQRRFVSDVSHELRTPLTTVRMAADVLHAARGDFPPAVARSAELLQHELDRFEALLVDLLEISRHDARAATLEAESVDLRELVRGVAELSCGHADRTGCPLELRLPTHPVRAEVDPRRVQRIMRNLVSNALEHGERRPVEVCLAGDDDAVAVVVRDHGVGLRPGEATLVFNRFWRADPARARSSGGTGLGLSIALEDARLHGGWLQAWGEPGRGSSFRLTLPRRAGADLASSPLPLEPVDERTSEVAGA